MTEKVSEAEVDEATRKKARELARTREPAEVFCLAELLCDEMQARGWRTEDVAVRMGGSTIEEIGRDLLCVDLLMCVHKDNLLVGDRMFSGFAKAFGVNEQFLRNIDEQWRKWPDRRSPFEPPESIFGPVSRRSAIRLVPDTPAPDA